MLPQADLQRNFKIHNKLYAVFVNIYRISEDLYIKKTKDRKYNAKNCIFCVKFAVNVHRFLVQRNEMKLNLTNF